MLWLSEKPFLKWKLFEIYFVRLIGTPNQNYIFQIIRALFYYKVL